AHADGAVLPARKDFVDRLTERRVLGPGRQQLDESPGHPVAGAKLYFLHAVEHVELGDAQARNTVDLDGALERGGVEPAAAPRPAGGGAEFVPALAQPPADRAVELRRRRPRAHARGIRLGAAADVA